MQKMQMFENYLSGLVHLTHPLYVSDLDVKGATMTRPVFDENGRRAMVPYFPANDLRGRLHRKAAVHVINALTAGGERLSLELYMGLQCGAGSSQPDSAPLTVEEAVRAKRNIVMGLFGGGARVLPSHFSTADWMPITKATVESKTVPGNDGLGREFKLPRDESDLYVNNPTSKINNTRRDDVFDAENPELLERSIEGGAATVAAYQAHVMATDKDRKDAKKSGETNGDTPKKQGAANIFSANEIAPGIQLWNSIMLDACLTKAQLGLLLQAFSDLVAEQRLGGASKRGNGRFICQNMVVRHAVLGGDELPVFEAEGSHVLSPQVQPAIDAMREELAALDLAEMTSYFVNRKTKEAA
jgi:CRISPR type IV-associated protein Csf2